MASQSLIVQCVILKSTRVVSAQAFNVLCIFGPSARITEPTAYNDPSQMLVANGGTFESSDPEYIEARAAMSQAIRPPKFLVAPNSAAVAQTDTFQVGTLTTGHQYKFTMDSVVISYTASGGDTQQSVLAALLTAIGVAFPTNPPVTGAVTSTGPAAILTLVSTIAGLGVSLASIDGLLVHVNTIANHSIADDIVIAQNSVSFLNQFYGVIVTSHAAADILQVATYIETQLLVYVTATLDAGCLLATMTDIMAQLQALAFDRTMILFSAVCNTNGPDGAWMGYMISTTPGIGNWADKTLVGVPADNLNPTQIANVLSKNGNIYVNEGGNGCTLYGKTPAGDYFDVVIFLDWVASDMKTGTIAVVTDPLNLKIGYDNNGINQLETPIRKTMQQGQANKGFLPGWDVFAPNANDVSSEDRKARVLNNIGFDGELDGAINTINIQGYVTS